MNIFRNFVHRFQKNKDCINSTFFKSEIRNPCCKIINSLKESLITYLIFFHMLDKVTLFISAPYCYYPRAEIHGPCYEHQNLSNNLKDHSNVTKLITYDQIKKPTQQSRLLKIEFVQTVCTVVNGKLSCS